jgi:gamma-glutamyltranspeptidase/glutathione hydrolase
MSKNLSRQLRIFKDAVRSKRGAVAAKNQAAADIGARVLSQGGNAVDAAIATSFALSILEPWTSGLGSNGCMMIWDARKCRGQVIEFLGNVPAPARAGASFASQLVGRSDEPDALVRTRAYRTIAIPGLPDGLWTAHAFGTKPWTTLLAPAIELSEEGLELDWYALLTITANADELARFPASREWFLPYGKQAPFERKTALANLRNPALTATLMALAERGARDFYEGSIAHAFIHDVREGGGYIEPADLAAYRAKSVEPVTVVRAGKRLLTPPNSQLGKLFREVMSDSNEWHSAVDQSTYLRYAQVIAAAHADFTPEFDDARDGWSSHISVIDEEGNIASLSQSLGASFGSKIVLPGTGILANNAGAVPGTADNAGVARFAQHNLLPMIGIAGERPWLAMGVSGDRHILPTLIQLISFLIDFGFSVEDAFSHPRIGMRRPGEILIDPIVSSEIKQAIRQSFQVREEPASLYPFARPCAVAVCVDGISGERVAMTDTSEPWAGACAASQRRPNPFE